eukprot:gb/GECG01005966.1/.p1 GENE.gb/GECG01005966.1/~~gb/GECG01005966.1/.p1  ORF type:complete len:143 (+),score=20.82 gb/GECG01005966.1/:1-429(+)
MIPHLASSIVYVMRSLKLKHQIRFVFLSGIHADFTVNGCLCCLQPPIFLVGTKSDLESDRAVAAIERNSKAREWGVPSFEVSSKDNIGVDEVFTKMVQEVLRQSVDPQKGGGGGSVMGAGRTPEERNAKPEGGDRKKKCSIL